MLILDKAANIQSISQMHLSVKFWWLGPDGNKCNGGKVYGTINLNTDPVPEPTTMLLFGAGVAGLVGVTRRKRNKIS